MEMQYGMADARCNAIMIMSASIPKRIIRGIEEGVKVIPFAGNEG
jgi:hypothetical protein